MSSLGGPKKPQLSEGGLLEADVAGGVVSSSLVRKDLSEPNIEDGRPLRRRPGRDVVRGEAPSSEASE